jgi:hypothetical protein
MAEKKKEEKKKSKIAILGWIVAIIFIHMVIIFSMKTFGKFSYPTIILFTFLSWLLIGFIWFLVYYFIIRKRGTDKTSIKTVTVAVKLAEEELYRTKGLKSLRTLHTSKIAIGNDIQKESYLLWIFIDHIKTNMMIAYFDNLEKLGTDGLIPSEEGEKYTQFYERVVRIMNATASPMKEKNTFVDERLDSLGNVISRRTGISPTPIQQLQQDFKKDEVDVT